MDTLLSRIRHTTCTSVVGLRRTFLGLLFLSTGVMKFAVPSTRNASSGQLIEADVSKVGLFRTREASRTQYI